LIRNKSNYQNFWILIKCNIYEKRLCLSKKMWLSAVLLLTMVLTLWLFLKCLYWATMSMIHQVLEEYNSLPTTQTKNRLPENCWNYLTSTY